MRDEFLWVEKYRPKTVEECILPRNIKILPGTYDVVISQKLLSRFTSKNHDLIYYIALEPDSTFG